MSCRPGCSTASIGADILAPLLTTFGLSIILQNAMLTGFSADSRRLTSDGIETASLPLFNGLAIGVMPLLTFIAAVGVIVALNQLFYRTALGRAFRAVSDDPVTARLMGIDDKQLFAIAMGVALAVCAIAALFLGLRANFDPTIGPGRLIFAFEAVIIGGLGSLWGTLAGGVDPRRRADDRRLDQSGMAIAGRPSRLSRRARGRAARPVSARGGLRRWR